MSADTFTKADPSAHPDFFTAEAAALDVTAIADGNARGKAHIEAEAGLVAGRGQRHAE